MDNNTTIDLGCGPRKIPGAYGVDIYQYEGVDQTFDMDQYPWPLDSNRYHKIYARHVIEHIADIPKFMNEIHRIASADAIVEIITPHFSSLDSWEDPTHRWHLACNWYKTFTESYLTERTPDFDHLSTNIKFSSSFRNQIGKYITKLASINYWEKHYAFIFRARNITTQLRIIK